MVLRPRRDGELGNFVQRLTTTHVRRWHLHRNGVGSGNLYQGTYKSFPVQDDEHFLTVCRYVEQNPLRAGLVRTGTKSGRLALVEPACRLQRNREANRNGLIGVAGPQIDRLGFIGQPSADTKGAGGTALISAKGASFWERKLDDGYGRSARGAVHDAWAWTAAQREIENWTYPLFHPRGGAHPGWDRTVEEANGDKRNSLDIGGGSRNSSS
jgi:hypothetical protein